MSRIDELKKISVVAKETLNAAGLFLKTIAPLAHPSYMSEENKNVINMYRQIMADLENKFQYICKYLTQAEKDELKATEKKSFINYSSHKSYVEIFDDQIALGRDFAFCVELYNDKDYFLNPFDASKMSASGLVYKCDDLYDCAKGMLRNLKANQEEQSDYKQAEYERALQICYDSINETGEIGIFYIEVLDIYKGLLNGIKDPDKEIDLYKRMQKFFVKFARDYIEEFRKNRSTNSVDDRKNEDELYDILRIFSKLISDLEKGINSDRLRAEGLDDIDTTFDLMRQNKDQFLERYASIIEEVKEL